MSREDMRAALAAEHVPEKLDGVFVTVRGHPCSSVTPFTTMFLCRVSL